MAEIPPASFLIYKGRGVYILRNIQDIEFDLQLIGNRLKKYADMYVALELERKLTIAYLLGQEVSAKIEAEKLMERIKQ